jgi:hypothetical protein
VHGVVAHALIVLGDEVDYLVTLAPELASIEQAAALHLLLRRVYHHRHLDGAILARDVVEALRWGHWCGLHSTSLPYTLKQCPNHSNIGMCFFFFFFEMNGMYASATWVDDNS